jgi:hypothetical protein
MKVISYSIFGDPSSFEFPFYLRGLYFNARMNRLIYPDWSTRVHVCETLTADGHEYYRSFIVRLQALLNIDVRWMKYSPMCEAMLWRMSPVFDPTVFHVICRDADAITTYREAQAVSEWIKSGFGFHGITDNPAHSIPMMGGMVGFDGEHFRIKFGRRWGNLRDMIGDADLYERGSDQSFMMKNIYPYVKDDMMGHFFEGCKERVAATKQAIDHSTRLPLVSPRLWESNLTCRHIGSAGVVEMETLRFFQRFDKTDYSAFEKQFPKIFYWHE